MDGALATAGGCRCGELDSLSAIKASGKCLRDKDITAKMGKSYSVPGLFRNYLLFPARLKSENQQRRTAAGAKVTCLCTEPQVHGFTGRQASSKAGSQIQTACKIIMKMFSADCGSDKRRTTVASKKLTEKPKNLICMDRPHAIRAKM